MHVEAKLEELGLALPEPAKLPPRVQASFAWVRIYGDRVYVSGHGPLAPDGTPSGPFGKVEVSPEQGYEAARSTALAVRRGSGSGLQRLCYTKIGTVGIVAHALLGAE